MKIMKCRNCEYTFDNKKAKIEKVTIGENPHCDILYPTCPICGSTDIVIVEFCDLCGRYKPAAEVDNGICDDCMEEMLQNLALKQRRERQIKEIKEQYGIDIDKFAKEAFDDYERRFGIEGTPRRNHSEKAEYNTDDYGNSEYDDYDEECDYIYDDYDTDHDDYYGDEYDNYDEYGDDEE